VGLARRAGLVSSRFPYSLRGPLGDRAPPGKEYREERRHVKMPIPGFCPRVGPALRAGPTGRTKIERDRWRKCAPARRPLFEPFRSFRLKAWAERNEKWRKNQSAAPNEDPRQTAKTRNGHSLPLSLSPSLPLSLSPSLPLSLSPSLPLSLARRGRYATRVPTAGASRGDRPALGRGLRGRGPCRRDRSRCRSGRS
jgi:hypothetical protein